jgi:hypothetical protein
MRHRQIAQIEMEGGEILRLVGRSHLVLDDHVNRPARAQQR